MPPGNEGQLSDVDLDQKIAERSRAIALNQNDAKAYRDRGLLLARKREYDLAMSDFNKALLLNPNDAHAFGLRGLVWEKKNDSKGALADLEKAIQLDPANAAIYRSHRENILRNAAHIGDDGGDPAATPHGLGGFFKRLAQYYAEFLSTDFKKQRLPRRRLQTSDAQGRLVGIPLRKYLGFQQKMWEELAKPINTGLSIKIARGNWRSSLPKAVVEATTTHIGYVTQEDLDEVVNTVLGRVAGIAKTKGSDPVIAFEKFVEDVRAAIARRVISPLLGRMEGFFARTENKPIESLRELEDQLSARLSSGIESASGAAFSKLLVEGTSEPLENVLRDQLEIAVVRSELQSFFDTFSASDLYVELSDLVRSSRLIDNVDFYMHVGEIHHAGHIFPAFYIPFAAERTDYGFTLTSEPRLYANKRAMDFVAQEVAKAEGRASTPSSLRERIFYLSPEQRPLQIAQKLFDDMAGGFNLKAEIDFNEPRDQKISSLLVAATNRLCFGME